MDPYFVYCDGSYRKGLGIAVGICITNSQTQSCIEKATFIPTSSNDLTNSFKAELQSILYALKELIDMNLSNDTINILCDNKQLVLLLNNIELIDNTKVDYPEVYDIIKHFPNIRFYWLPRRLNSKAHKLCHSIILKKALEKRSKKLKVIDKGDDIFLAQSTNNKNIFYTVNLKAGTCNCRHFSKDKKCKHIIAAELNKLSYNK